MKQVEICVRDESGEVISTQELELDTGTGRFDEIEEAIEQFRQHALKELTRELFEQEQGRFIEAVKKRPLPAQWHAPGRDQEPAWQGHR